MTKTQVEVLDEKAPQPVVAQQHQIILCYTKVDASSATYVCGILSTIFCCFPCGVIGLVHAMIAKHEGERGNVAVHERRLEQANFWISFSMCSGFLTILFIVIAAVCWYYDYADGYEYEGYTGSMWSTASTYYPRPVY